MHSNCSDGSDCPHDLLLKAKEAGLDGISITDHDTISAYSPELFHKAAVLELDLMTGVEFSAFYKETSVHVLGYNFDLESKVIHEFCMRHKTRRKNRNIKMLERLTALGMPLDPKDIYFDEEATIGRPHIGEAMVKKGYVESVQDAFNRWLGDGKPAYIQGEKFDINETIAVLKQSGGKVVMAHPILIEKKSLLKELCKLDFDGWECYYARFSSKQNDEMALIADKYGFIKTGGSDYHGAIKPFNQIGSAYTDGESIARLKQRE